MRTMLFLLAGFMLLAAFFLLARLFSANHPAASTWAGVGFVSLWFAVAAFNMWTGVTRAGYSAAEELPILLLIFGVPTAAALFIKWRVF